MTTTTATAPTVESYSDRIDRERRERQEASATAARDVSAALTAATGERWTGSTDPENHTTCYTLTRSRDGLTVSVSLSSHRRPQAWHVYPGHIPAPDGSRLWLSNHRQRDEDTSANVGAAKSPQQIARDIARRVLPIAEELARRALEADATAKARAAWLEETTARFIAATRDRVPLESRHHDPTSTRRELRHWGKPYITVTLDAYDHEAKIEVDDITPDVALALLAQLPPAPAAKDEDETEAEG